MDARVKPGHDEIEKRLPQNSMPTYRDRIIIT